MAALSNTGFLPAQARTIIATVYPPVVDGSNLTYNWPNKNVNSTLDYWFDLTQIMVDAGTTIIQASAEVISGDFDLQVVDTAWSDVYVRVILSAGNPSVDYVIALTVVREDGNIDTYEIGLYTESLSQVTSQSSGPFITLNGILVSIGPYVLPDGNQLGAGVPNVYTATDTSVVVSAGTDGDGVRPFHYTFYRALDSYGTPGTFVALGVSSEINYITDTSLVEGNTYWYRYTITDSSTAPVTITSSSVAFTMPVFNMVNGC